MCEHLPQVHKANIQQIVGEIPNITAEEGQNEAERETDAVAKETWDNKGVGANHFNYEDVDGMFKGSGLQDKLGEKANDEAVAKAQESKGENKK